MTRCVSALLAAASVLAFAGSAGAQEAAPADAQPTETSEVIVTAQRREQALQDVPLAISVVTAQALEASNLTTIADIQFLSPGVNYNANFGGGFNIRGVGTQSILITGEQSVALVIDDVIQGLPEIAFAGPSYQSLSDVQRIEVLKGPQGTLFGKNSSAGVIHIITRRPTLEVIHADASISYGSRSELNVESSLNVPLGQTAALRLSGIGQRRDGFLPNRFTGQDIGAYNRFGLRAKLLWKPTDALSVLLSGDYREASDDGNGEWTLRNCGSGYRRTATTPVLYRACDELARYGIVAGPKNREVALDGPTYADQTSKLASLRIDYLLGDATLTSITGYRDLVQDIAIDTDASPRQIYSFNPTITGGTQFTQELRLNGETGIFNYTLGAFYYEAKPYQVNEDRGTFGLVPDNSTILFSNNSVGPGTASGYSPRAEARVESYAVFGQIEARVLENLTLIAGGRYTKDDVSQTITYFDTPGQCSTASFLASGACHPAGGIPGPFFAATEADKFTYKLTAKYDITPDINVYATYSTGYKGPLISNPSGQPQQLVRPETSESYEIGLKSALFDRRLILNVDVFKVDYTDFQGQQRVQLTPALGFFTTTNAGSLQTRGVEADASFRVTPELTLSANVAYIPTKFTDYAVQCADAFTNPATAPGQCTYIAPGSPPGTPAQYNVEGFPLLYSPKWTFGVAADLNIPLSGGNSLTARASYYWRDDTYGVVADPNSIVPGYGLLNAQVGYGPEDGRWRLSVFARNLLDEHFVSGVFVTPVDIGASGTSPLSTRGYSNIPAMDAERTVGVKLEVSFGQ